MIEFEFSKEKVPDLLMDQETPSGIRKIWNKVEKDIRDTTGAKCVLRDPGTESRQAVIVAVRGCGQLAGALEERISELRSLDGKWECYGFYLVKQPLEGIEEALVIVGSDKLGAIYGMFHLSELLGVTAWGFWGDVTPPSYERAVLICSEDGRGVRAGQSINGVPGEFAFDEDLADKRQNGMGINGKIHKVKIVNSISKEPSVKYRGFFINDEWPCFGTWTFSHYNGFTAEVYEHVFEYLLRMKGNYLWPAMWTSSFLLDGPGLASMELATEYGIFIGMSHHEPCMRSGEEFSIFKGEDSPYGKDWDYRVNKDGLMKFWEDGLKRVKGQNIFPTVGMRGEADSKVLEEDATIEDNVVLLKRIITNQRKLIAEHINPDLKQVPQLFAIYKEVEDYYFGDGQTEGVRGFDELEDVTLLFCEDNFGNMRALPQGEERNHPGGFGMYYHFDYHGSPISYEWVNSTPLSKVWEQMTEAYEYGVKNLWIVNVGDVKFNEYPLGYFLDLAYDFDTWGSGAQNMIRVYTRNWVRNQFGCYVSERQLEDIVWVLEEYVRLNALRRPESCNASVYHYAHYGEGRRMLERCERLEKKNEELLHQLSGTPARCGYYSMIYFPAAASANLLKMYLTAGLNDRASLQGKAVANIYGEQLSRYIERDRELARNMGSFRDGKWSGMEKAFHIGFVNWNSEDWRYPLRHVVTLPEEPRLVVSRVDGTKSFTNQYFPIILEFNDFLSVETDTVVIQIANGGRGEIHWSIAERCDYLEFSSYEGDTAVLDEIEVRVHKECIPVDEIQEFRCNIRTANECVPVLFRVLKRDLTGIPSGAFLERNRRCVLDAAEYQEAAPGITAEGEAVFGLIPDFGKFESGMKVFPTTAVFGPGDWEKGQAPSLTYDVWIFCPGKYRLQLHTSPANPLIYGGELKMGVSVNSGEVRSISLIDENYRGGDGTCQSWCDAVLNQEHVAELPVTMQEGLNRITVYAGDAGVVLERLTLYEENKPLKESCLGPQKSFRME